MSKWNDSIFLVDANYVAYRGLYGLFQAPISEIENAMFYGFTNTLISIGKGVKVGKERIKPKNIILCWDSKHSYRRMLYPGYKKRPDNLDDHQKKVIEAVQVAFPKLRSWMQRINIPGYLYAGYEADDLMAAFVKQFNHKFIIVTRDEDLFQMLNKRVAMYRLVKKEKKLYTVDTFIDKYGIGPNKWARVKAIGGCTSDTIPGVKGIGEKTAIKYLADGDMGVSIHQSSKILSNIERIDLFETLTTLPLEGKVFPQLSIDKREPDWDAFTKFCQVYNFKSFIMKFKDVMEALT